MRKFSLYQCNFEWSRKFLILMLIFPLNEHDHSTASHFPNLTFDPVSAMIAPAAVPPGWNLIIPKEMRISGRIAILAEPGL